MSLTFNMVGGGGGGLKNTDAVLIVTVPTGSTVTATKGSTTLTPTMWVKAADASLDCAIFNISASLFDSTTPWTVTATDGTNTASTTVLITSNKEYEVELSYNLILFKNANEYSAVTGGWSAIGKSGGSQGWGGAEPTVSKYTDYYGISFPASKGSIFATKNAIDLTDYAALKVRLRHDASFTSGAFMFGAFDKSTLDMNGFGTGAAAYQSLQGTTVESEIVIAVDITAVTGSWNVGFAHYKNTTDVINYLWEVWAEK